MNGCGAPSGRVWEKSSRTRSGTKCNSSRGATSKATINTRASLSFTSHIPHSPSRTPMPRPRTLFTGQWADLPLEKMAALAKGFGYDGLELACWGDHFDVEQAAGPNGAPYC